jgi:hypothetical protein
VIVSLVEWGVVNAVTDGFEQFKFWWAILMDSASLTFPFLFFGLYTTLPFQMVQIFSSLPFLFMIFFSTTFSPGSGVEIVKELRYLFARCVRARYCCPCEPRYWYQYSHCVRFHTLQLLFLVHDSRRPRRHGRLPTRRCQSTLHDTERLDWIDNVLGLSNRKEICTACKEATDNVQKEQVERRRISRPADRIVRRGAHEGQLVGYEPLCSKWHCEKASRKPPCRGDCQTSRC